jgi:methylated-DNA-protein-cysteine methyltransferase-like protein
VKTDEADTEVERTLAERVYEVISRIPSGYVTSYGSIARAVGLPRGARQIGWLLHSVPEQLNLPCHRVVNSQGFLSGGWNFGHPDIMKAMLIDEGVPFSAEYRVAIKKCFWEAEAEVELSAAHKVNDFDLVT